METTTMSDAAQVAMDGSPATSELFNRKNVQDFNDGRYGLLDGVMEDAGPFGEIKWQLGPVGEVGINGTTVEDVIEVCIARIAAFNEGPFRCRENSLAITAMEEARNWLLQRTRARQEQGVEGTNASHAS